MRFFVFVTLIALCCARAAQASEVVDTQFVEVGRFSAPEARQAVAVDAQYFYAITNRMIAQYDKHSGMRVRRWQTSERMPLEHLNSGVVIEGELFCAHSNFPKYPEVSSVEVWDTDTLEHVQSHSMGIYEGSLTWIDWHDGAWWAVFAHYSQRVNDNPHAKDASWTSLVKFDRQWRRVAGWVFPADVLARFEPHSCSGGSWGPDGLLYCTGHDLGELYALTLPEAGSMLVLRKIFKVPFTGQGFAWDPDEYGTAYGIDRVNGEVIAASIPALTRKPELVNKTSRRAQR